ncbi:Zn(II)2Cys6 transcription factor domain-containing protein [Aspergillus undulatus]|uniref:Zn(II)2Cys6 transcription factor domain-containing protein n=1 Tax=Aspergillus undulatus TaxID=1810928 RepID=UPI003CCE3449
MTATPAISRSSIGPLKSRRGCKTCKARRVKCGEEKPHCLRCSKTGRKCEYQYTTYGTFSSGSSVSIIDTSLSVSPNRSWRERRAFTYYFQHAAPMIGGLDADFWSTILPQVSHTEPAVWDAIISISSLFESYKLSTPTHKYQDALGWYSRSVSAVRQRIECGGTDVFVNLISCVLFICIEALQGGAEEALRLYKQGVNLVLALRDQVAEGSIPASRASLVEDTIVPMFARLSLLGNSQNQMPVGALLRDSDRALPPGFVDLKSAREAMFVLTAETHLLQKACEAHHDSTSDYHVPGNLMAQQVALLSKLKNWCAAFNTLVEFLRTKPISTPHQTRIIALLQTHHETLVILITTCVSRFKTTTDACISNFQTIVEQSRIALDASARSDGSQPPFTLDIGVGFPLLVAVLRCAEPTIRRQAVALMRRAPSVQGVYANSLGAAFCETVIRIEEMLAANMAASQGTSFPQSPDQSYLPVTGIQSPGNDSNASISTVSMTISMRIDRSPSPHPALASMPIHVGIPLPIPEEARIKPYAVFRPRDGIPPGLEGDVARWNVDPDTTFLRYSRNRLNPETGEWWIVDEIIPLDFNI